MGRVLFLSAILLIESVSYSQPITWQRVFFDTPFTAARKSQQTYEGGFITTGYTGSNQGRIYVIKQNPFGDTLWIKWTERSGFGWWVEQTQDKGLVVAASTDVQNTTGYLFKTDSLGNMIWERLYINIHGYQVRCVKQTPDSGYILALSWNLSNGQPKIMLMETDSIGQTIWQSIYYGPARETPDEVNIVNNSGYVVLGNTSNGFISGTDIFIIRVNLNGDTLWTKIIGSPNYGDVGYKIQNTLDGGFILCGWTASFTNGQKHESYVVKLDSLGNIQWQRTYSGLGGDEALAIRKKQNGYVLAGYSDSLNDGNGRAKIRLLDNAGNVLRQTSFSPFTEPAAFYSVELASDGGFILCGLADDPAIGNFARAYIVKTDSLGYATPIGITNNNHQIPADFKLYQNYPNPFNSQTIISFDLKGPADVRLTLYDILGKEIAVLLNKFMPLSKGQIIFDAEKFNLSSGVYFYNLTVNSDNPNSKSISLNKTMVYLK